MDERLFERLLYCGESETLDFKVDNYSFGKGETEEETSKLLKDVLSFGNAWRNSDAYILIGVQEEPGKKAIVRGITKTLRDHELQQFVNGKLNRPLLFSYEEFCYNGFQCAAIRVPVQERPFHLKSDFGDLKGGQVYIRRGSSTAEALPDEVANMGRLWTPGPAFEILAVAKQAGTTSTHWFIDAWLANKGNGTAEQLKVRFDLEAPMNGSTDLAYWEVNYSGPVRNQSARAALHPEDVVFLSSWRLQSREAKSLIRQEGGRFFTRKVTRRRTFKLRAQSSALMKSLLSFT
jgi:hypothetical protein